MRCGGARRAGGAVAGALGAVAGARRAVSGRRGRADVRRATGGVPAAAGDRCTGEPRARAPSATSSAAAQHAPLLLQEQANRGAADRWGEGRTQGCLGCRGRGRSGCTEAHEREDRAD